MLTGRGLRGRANWQTRGGANASVAEQTFYEVFSKALEGTPLSIRPRPSEFEKIYINVTLPRSVEAEIFKPEQAVTTHGVRPDFAIENLAKKKTLYVEVKRQDGWVEGKERKAGRGNAHERSCKYFTPGLLKILRAQGRLGNKVLPFWTVFQGDISRDPCRVREITLWYAENTAHFFMWRDATNSGPLVKHFNTHLKKLLL